MSGCIFLVKFLVFPEKLDKRMTSHAVVQPLSKKPNCDSHVFSYFRPISNFLFNQNVLEKMVFMQLQFFLNAHK